MYVMAALVFGSLLLGLSGRLSSRVQVRLAIAAAVVATAVYYASQWAM